MYRKIFVLFFRVFVINTAYSQQLTAQQIIEKSIKAQGGRAILENVRTLRTEYKAQLEGRNVTYVIKEMAPNKGSFEIVYEDRVVYKEFFNGTAGFRYERGRKVPADSAEFKDKLFRKNIFNDLDYLDTGLNSIELIGEATVNKEQAYKIKVILRNGAEDILYYSKESFLPVKKEKIKLQEPGRSNATLFEKYKRFENILMAAQLILYAGTPEETILKVSKVYINEKVSFADFE